MSDTEKPSQEPVAGDVIDARIKPTITILLNQYNDNSLLNTYPYGHLRTVLNSSEKFLFAADVAYCRDPQLVEMQRSDCAHPPKVASIMRLLYPRLGERCERGGKKDC